MKIHRTKTGYVREYDNGELFPASEAEWLAYARSNGNIVAQLYRAEEALRFPTESPLLYVQQAGRMHHPKRNRIDWHALAAWLAAFGVWAWIMAEVVYG